MTFKITSPIVRLVLAAALDSMFTALPFLIVPALGQRYGIPKELWGFLLAAGAAALLIANVFWSQVLAKRGPRDVLLACGIIRALGFACVMGAASAPAISLALMLLSAGGGTGIAVRSITATRVDDHHRPVVHAQVGAGTGLGILLAPLIGGLLVIGEGYIALITTLLGLAAGTAGLLASQALHALPIVRAQVRGEEDGAALARSARLIASAPSAGLIGSTLLSAAFNNLTSVVFTIEVTARLGWRIDQLALAMGTAGALAIALQLLVLGRMARHYRANYLLALSWFMAAAGVGFLLPTLQATAASVAAFAALIAFGTAFATSGTVIANALGDAVPASEVPFAYLANSAAVMVGRLAGLMVAGAGTPLVISHQYGIAVCLLLPALGVVLVAGAMPFRDSGKGCRAAALRVRDVQEG